MLSGGMDYPTIVTQNRLSMLRLLEPQAHLTSAPLLNPGRHLLHISRPTCSAGAAFPSAPSSCMCQDEDHSSISQPQSCSLLDIWRGIKQGMEAQCRYDWLLIPSVTITYQYVQNCPYHWWYRRSRSGHRRTPRPEGLHCNCCWA